MRASDVMTTEVKTVTPTTSVAEIVKLLISNRISAVPVLSASGKLVGMVSEADLLHRAETGTEARRPWWLDLFTDPAARAEAFLKAHGRTAEDVMTRDVQVIAPDTPLGDVAELMEERRVKRLPVVDQGELVGIVARADLIRVLSRAAPIATSIAVDDLAIKDHFEDAARQAGFGGIGSMTVDVRSGKVHLWGVCESPAERRALEVAAAEIPGVQSVENHLAVRSAYMQAF